MGNCCASGIGGQQLEDDVTSMVMACPVDQGVIATNSNGKMEQAECVDDVSTAPSESLLSLEFNAGSEKEVVHISEAPLGFELSTAMPLKVVSLEAGSVMEKAGVLPGWILTKVGEQDVMSLNYQDAAALIAKETANLPQRQVSTGTLEAPFVVTFCVAAEDGEVTRDIKFDEKPLGMMFENTMPLIISRVVLGGNAEHLGVKPGWRIKAMNGKAMAGLSYRQATQILKEETLTLPRGLDR